jgi:accessory gene regulator B
MVEKMSQYIVNNLLIDDQQVDEDQRDIMLFGVTRILEDVPKFISIFIICYLLNILKELLIVFIITLCYKTLIGGAHARTNIQCLLVSLVYFILPIILAKYINYDLYIFYIIFAFTILFSVYTIIKIAPADTEEIPIINKKKRRMLKFAGGVSLILINVIIVVFVKDIIYIKIIIYTIFLINIFATRLMFRMLKCKPGIESEEYGKLY